MCSSLCRLFQRDKTKIGKENPEGELSNNSPRIAIAPNLGLNEQSSSSAREQRDDLPLPPRSTVSTSSRPKKAKKEPESAGTTDFGLKILYDNGDAEVDIVALHGLNGHREKTFTAENGTCWLSSLLPVELPKIRVFSYGYDVRTHSTQPLSHEHLHSHAEQLLEKLTVRRERTKTTRRPIIFVGYSLGGIIIKSALVLSANFTKDHLEEQKGIKLSTYGILFMGTPHSGGEGVTWAKLAVNLASVFFDTNSTNLKHLERNSEWLEQQQSQYLGISNHFDTKFFYETLSTPLPGGGKLLVVPRSSACIPGALNAAKVAIHANHTSMVRFSGAEDENFQTVADRLKIMLGKAAQKVGKNWEEWEATKGVGNALEISYSIGFNLPFPRNESFTGREEELLKMHEVLHGPYSTSSQQQHRKFVLHGLGGIGKTQLAIEYAYRYQKDYTSIWWVNAATMATLSQSFIGIAQKLVTHHAQCQAKIGRKPDYSSIAVGLGMPADSVNQNGVLNASEDITQILIDAIKSWLIAEQNQRWLLIIDNYDDLENVDLKDFLPAVSVNSSGSILFTSRASSSKRLGIPLEVKEVGEDDAVEILRKSAGKQLAEVENERDDAVAIITKLGSLPLALDQAGAYIGTAQIKLSEYLPKFEKEFVRIAARRPPKAVWQYREDTVYTTWEISFAALSPAAQELLLLCAFLDNEDISEELLPPQRLKDEFEIDSVEDAIFDIFSLSLAKRKNSGDGFWIHPLVHRWSRERLDGSVKEQKALAAISLTASAASFSGDSRTADDSIRVRALMLHVQACFEHVCRHRYLEDTGVNIDFLEDLKELASAFNHYGVFQKAIELYQWALAQQETILGRDHPSTLDTVHNMASVFNSQGRYEEALEWYGRALAGYEKALDRDHPSTLGTVNNMASVFNSQGRYEEALEWYGRALAGCEKALGGDHPSTLDTVQNMAAAFDSQGRYEEALEWYGRALAGYEKALGRDHPSTLSTVNNMALVFDSQGRYEEALEWYGRALAGQEKALGRDHPSTLGTVNNMAMVFDSQGRYEEALEWYGRALAGCEKALGRDHPSTLNTVNNMAVVFKSQGRYEEALEWYGRALAGKEKALGRDHPSTLSTVHNMAMVFDRQGRYEEALEWYGRALAGKEKALGRDHPSTLGTVNNMASVFDSQGRYEEALEWYGRALAGKEKALGRDHPSTLSTVHNMAVVFDSQGRYEEALEWYGRALAGKEKALGSDHPSTKLTRNCITKLKSRYSSDE